MVGLIAAVAALGLAAAPAAAVIPDGQGDDQETPASGVDETEATSAWPLPASFDDRLGIDWDSVTIPDVIGVDYSVSLLEGGTGHRDVVEPGTHLLKDLFALTGEDIHLVVEARPAPGFRLPTDNENELVSEMFYTGNELVNPVDPDDDVIEDRLHAEKVDLAGVENDKLVFPDTENVTFEMYILEDGEPGPGTPVTGEVLAYQYASLIGDDHYEVHYRVIADEGYVLPGGFAHADVMDWFSSVGSGVPDPDTVVIDTPDVTVIDADGVDGDKLILPEIDGVTYRISVHSWQDGAAPDDVVDVQGEVLVRQYGSFVEEDHYKIYLMALAPEGHLFPSGATYWEAEYEFSTLGDGAEPAPAPVVIDIPAVTQADIDGKAGYVLPQYTGGFTWYVNGQTIDALVEDGQATFVPAPSSGMSVSATGGFYQVTAEGLGVDIDDIVIAAAAEDGYVLSIAGGEPGDIAYAADSRTAAELETPTVVDAFGTEDDTFTIPAVPGLVFTDQDGNILDPGTYPVTAEYIDGEATITLAVSATAGYRLEVGGQPVEATPGVAGTHLITLVFTDATAPVGDDRPGGGDDRETGGDDTDEPGGGDEGETDGEETGEPDESTEDQAPDESTGDQVSGEDETGTPGEPAAAGTDGGDSSGSDDGQDDSKGSSEAAASERLAQTGAGGTVAAGLIALALLMAGATLIIARRTTQAH